MNNVEAVAVANQRSKIPTATAVMFEQFSNVELASMSADALLNAELRAFSGWELDYREAMAIDVYYDANTDQMKRRRSR